MTFSSMYRQFQKLRIFLSDEASQSVLSNRKFVIEFERLKAVCRENASLKFCQHYSHDYRLYPREGGYSLQSSIQKIGRSPLFLELPSLSAWKGYCSH
jgi:hypothetical protein